MVRKWIEKQLDNAIKEASKNTEHAVHSHTAGQW